MRAPLLTTLLALGLGLPASAQDSTEPPSAHLVPDESWLSFPGQEAVPPPLEAMPPPPPPPRFTGPEREVRAPAEPPKPNRVSLYGAQPLEPGQVAASLLLGFPLASARASMGVLPRLNAGLGADSLYGIMNEVNAHARFTVVEGEVGHLALTMEGGYAFFLKPPAQEEHGARYFTGRRNWNLMPGVVGSIVTGKRTRGFLDLRYHLAFDTQPFQRTPLGGAPEGVQVGGNFLLRTGVEVPFSERTSYVIMLGANIHGRPEDAAFMPTLSVGVVTGL